MPMPPPKASTETARDRRVVHEVAQILRALHTNGPQEADDLRRLVGADYWDEHRFDRALAFSVSDGHVVRMNDGRFTAV